MQDSAVPRRPREPHTWRLQVIMNELARSCVANPAGFMDGVTVAVVTIVILGALAIRRNNR